MLHDVLYIVVVLAYSVGGVMVVLADPRLWAA
jgi:hypothetical protein